MKDNDVASLAEQFNLDPEIVKSSVDDGTLSTRIKDAMNKKVIYDTDKFDEFKKNYAKEVQDSHFSELISKAKSGEVPKELYDTIKGASMQQLERNLAKKYGVEDFDGVEDLIEKVKSSANGTDESQRLIEELRTANKKLLEEKESAVNTARQEYKSTLIKQEKQRILNSIPLNSEDPAKIQRLLNGVFNDEYSIDYDNDSFVVRKGDEVVKDEATRAPVSPASVYESLAKEYNWLKVPDTGGQGGKSSGHSTGRYESLEQFKSDMAARNIATTDPEYYKLYAESGLGNIKK